MMTPAQVTKLWAESVRLRRITSAAAKRRTTIKRDLLKAFGKRKTLAGAHGLVLHRTLVEHDAYEVPAFSYEDITEAPTVGRGGQRELDAIIRQLEGVRR